MAASGSLRRSALFVGSVAVVASLVACDDADDTRRSDAAVASSSTPEPAPDPDTAKRIVVAEAVIDAFYSYDADALADALDETGDTASLLYYQGWAEGGNYEVLDRMPCEATTPTVISCSITVRDDFAEALEFGFDVTDTFTFRFDENDAITSVTSSSDDPPLMREAFSWLAANRPELTDGVCEGLFEGDGPTPVDCARAVVEAFAQFAELQQ